MNNLKILSKLQNNFKWLAIAILVISFIGFADASYLSIEHLSNRTPNCSLIDGCDVVTESKYSEIFGIPIALGGVVFYLSIFLLTIAYLDTKKVKFLRYAALITPAGFIASIYLVSIMAFVLGAWCIYCIGSAISSTTLFILGMIVLKKTSR